MFAPESDSTILTWRGTSVRLESPPPQYFVYTLHFHNGGLPHGKQAATRHYTGLSGNLPARLLTHRAGYSGAALMAEVHRRGVTWELAQVVRCESFEEAFMLERRLKKHSASRRCPRCQGLPLDADTLVQIGGWPLRLHSEQARARRPMYNRYWPGG